MITQKQEISIAMYYDLDERIDEPTAQPSGSKRRFYDGHDRKVDRWIPTQAS